MAHKSMQGQRGERGGPGEPGARGGPVRIMLTLLSINLFYYNSSYLKNICIQD